MQFIDRVEIEVEGGKGGDGITAWRREKYVPAGGPAGGDGGHGGSVMFRATDRLQTLLDFKYKRSIKADDGKRGGSKNCTGASGEDLILDVPCGTIATMLYLPSGPSNPISIISPPMAPARRS